MLAEYRKHTALKSDDPPSRIFLLLRFSSLQSKQPPYGRLAMSCACYTYKVALSKGPLVFSLNCSCILESQTPQETVEIHARPYFS